MFLINDCMDIGPCNISFKLNVDLFTYLEEAMFSSSFYYSMGACAIYMYISTMCHVTHIEIYDLCSCTLYIPILDHSTLVIGREVHRKGYGSS